MGIFAVLVQTKLLTTALFTRVLLGRTLTGLQTVALVLLLFGVVLAQLKPMRHDVTPQMDFEVLTGVAATISISALSGFAAVYTEMVLKDCKPNVQTSGKDPLPYQQVQLALASMITMSAFGCFTDTSTVLNDGLWHGFDHATVLSIVTSAFGGLLVAAVLKYADSILKGYATAASLLLTGVFSALCFGTALTMNFFLGGFLVACSIVMYTHKHGAQSVYLRDKVAAGPPERMETA